MHAYKWKKNYLAVIKYLSSSQKWLFKCTCSQKSHSISFAFKSDALVWICRF